MSLNPTHLLLNILKFLLLPFTLIYFIITWLRNKLYDSGMYRSVTFSIPVITVGNLSVGGTGKTPHIEYIVRLLRFDQQIATMSRGYRRKTKGFILADPTTTASEIGDEPMQFHLKFPEVSVAVCEERVTGIPELIGIKPDISVILLDDAYQHRTVKAGLNILLTDYKYPFYEDYILPSGRLREQRNGYKRANIIIVTKCPPNISKAEQEQMIQKINPLSHQSIYFSYVKYGAILDLFTQEEYIINQEDLIILVTGIAKPIPLETYLNMMTPTVETMSYPDHHYFTQKDIDDIIQNYKKSNNIKKYILTTEKDATRLILWKDELIQAGIRIKVLPIEIEFIDKKKDFDTEIQEYIKMYQ